MRNKTISQAIQDAKAKKAEMAVENKFIKANNYYLHNFNMDAEHGKNSMLRFKLGVILKEKKQLKERMMEKLKMNDQLSSQYFIQMRINKKSVSSPIKKLNSYGASKVVPKALTRPPSVSNSVPSNKIGMNACSHI